MSPDDAFGRILEALHEAALDDARWPVASTPIEETCGIAGNFLIVGGGAEDDLGVYFARLLYRGAPRHDLAREYYEVYRPHDEAPARRRALADQAGAPEAGRQGTGRAGAPRPGGGRPAPPLKGRRRPAGSRRSPCSRHPHRVQGGRSIPPKLQDLQAF